LIDVADHDVVTVTLAGGDGERGPEIQMVTVETGSDQIVEGDTAFLDQIVHQVTSPAQDGARGVDALTSRLVSGRDVEGRGRNLGQDDTEPGLEEVVTSTGDGDGPLLTETGVASRATENDGNLGEPSRFANFADKVGNGFGTTVGVFFLFIISGKINKAGRQVGRLQGHFYYRGEIFFKFILIYIISGLRKKV